MATDEHKRTFIVFQNLGQQGQVQIRQTNSLETAARILREHRQLNPEPFKHPQLDLVVPSNAHEKDNYPYRNKIGPLFADEENAWGYQFLDPDDRTIQMSLWIEKRFTGEQEPLRARQTLKQELMAETVVAAAVRRICEIDYVANAVNVEVARRVNASFDEECGDFVFEKK